MRIVCHEEGTKLNSTVGSTNSTDFLMDMPSQRVRMERARTIFFTPLTLTGMISLPTNRSEHYSIISDDFL